MRAATSTSPPPWGPRQNPPVGWPDKGLWLPVKPTEQPLADKPVQSAGVDVGTKCLTPGTSIFEGPFSWPVMVLRDAALDHNIRTLADFTERHGLKLAPHGKTTMSPELFARQLAAGAWGLTFATPNQVLVGRKALRTPRIILANECVDVRALTWIATECATDPDFTFLGFVDSPAGVEAFADAARIAARQCGLDPEDLTGFGALVDLGYPGGRTGCRTLEAAAELAHAVAATAGVTLAGVAAYEGGLDSVDAVQQYLHHVRNLVLTLTQKGLLPAGSIVTAGGSAYFDVCADVLAQWPDDLHPTIVLRSGAYLTHDDGVYVEKTPFRRIEGNLRPALEVWASVISPGDPGRVIVGMGRRDAPYDSGMPLPLRVRRRGAQNSTPLTGCQVEKMDDQHAYLRGDADLHVGDLVCFGISHPCTAFDKWRTIPVLDEQDRLVEIVHTYF